MSLGTFSNSNSTPQSGISKEESLPAPSLFEKELIQSVPRQYIVTQLVENGFSDLANKLPHVSSPDHHVHEVVKEVAAALKDERQEQFDDMLATLALDESNLKETYNTITFEMFKGKTHWGKVITFVAFTSHIVLYCARDRKLKHKVSEIVEWADAVMDKKLHSWIEEQGGWQAFVEHCDLEQWRVSLSTALLGLGVGVSVVASGLVFLKKCLTS